MNDATTLRIAAVFSFFSPLAILAGVPFAAGVGGVGGPGPIDFGDGALLVRYYPRRKRRVAHAVA
jgi:hypothetical protein